MTALRSLMNVSLCVHADVIGRRYVLLLSLEGLYTNISTLRVDLHSRNSKR